MEDVKWLLRRCGLPILLLLFFVIAGVFCWGKQHAEKQKVAEEVWEPPVEIENSEAETEEAENAETSTESAYWFIPQASDDLLSEEEKEQLQSTVLSAAESVREIYKDIVIADAPKINIAPTRYGIIVFLYSAFSYQRAEESRGGTIGQKRFGKC